MQYAMLMIRRRLLPVTMLLFGSTAALSAQVVAEERIAPLAWLGLSYDAERDAEAGPVVVVSEVAEDSPAMRGGVRVGDVVLRLNGLSASPRLMRTISRALTPGDTVRLQVRRSGAERALTIVAAEAPESFRRRAARRVFTVEPDSLRRRMRIVFDSAFSALERIEFPRIEVLRSDSTMMLHFRDGDVDTTMVGPHRLPFMMSGDDSPRVRMLRRHMDETPRRLRHLRDGEAMARLPGPGELFHMQFDVGRRSVGGAEFAPIDASLGAYFGVERGLLVTRVAEDTPAYRAGLRSGDVVLEADGVELDGIDELREVVARSAGERIALRIVRERATREIAIQLD